MKIAIMGHSPIALETALRFHLHGSALTWYVDQDDFSHFDSSLYPPLHFTSAIGMGVLKEMNAKYEPINFSWNDWLTMYQKPLLDYLRGHQEVKFDEVVSVTKRFLAPGEVIQGRSRFFDLFRVIYRVNPKDFIEDQKDTNPETYQRLTEEFIHSLASTIEMYQDYDIVMDFRSDLDKASIAASGRALGEARKADKVQYGMDALKLAKGLKPHPDFREIALVGSDSLAAEILISMEEWIKESRSRLFIVSTEEDPFAAYMSVANAESLKKIKQIFKFIDDEFEDEINGFTVRLREWQELDDFVQAKIPRPAEPIPRLVYFSGHNVTAIDELIDRKRMFLTIEKPDFRFGKKQAENNLLDLKTVGVDLVLVGHTKKDLSMLELDHGEPGFFGLTPARPSIHGGWENDLLLLEGIEDEIFKLFSPADTH